MLVWLAVPTTLADNQNTASVSPPAYINDLLPAPENSSLPILGGSLVALTLTNVPERRIIIPEERQSWGDRIIQEAQRRGLSREDGELLVKISSCESGLDPTRWNYLNPTGDPTSKNSAYGLFQVIRSHELTYGISRMTPEGNIAIALNLYIKNGTKDWVLSKGCWSDPH